MATYRLTYLGEVIDEFDGPDDDGDATAIDVHDEFVSRLMAGEFEVNFLGPDDFEDRDDCAEQIELLEVLDEDTLGNPTYRLIRGDR